MMTVIVDTNVALVASSKMEETSRDCELACIDRIEQITMGDVKLALDDQRRIIDEYRRKLNPDGQPGVGDAFLKWVEINWANPNRCVRVPITPIENSETEFIEFPDAPELQKFDTDDRKFIAVAVAHGENLPILQAMDRQWWALRDALCRNCVTVEFICEADIQL